MTIARGQTSEINRLRRLDLNLLVALDCLLVERGVSKAARRLGVSQSTASGALAKLRRHFDDPLLQRASRSYALSPLAQRLSPVVAQTVSMIDRVFAGFPEFEPNADPIEFCVLGSEHGLMFAAAALSEAAATQSNDSRMLMRAFSFMKDAAKQLRESDGLLLADDAGIEDAERIDLGEDRLVIVRTAESAPVDSVSVLAERPWVACFEGDDAVASPMNRLTNASVHARFEVEVPSALSVPFYLQDTDRLALLPLSLAQHLPRVSRIVICEPPIKLEPVRIAFWWHRSRTEDPAHKWLRAVVAESGKPSILRP